MDVISFIKAKKIEREIIQAREGFPTLDDRIDTITLGNTISVKKYSDLPTVGESGRLYIVSRDETNSHKATLYVYRDGSGYHRIGGNTITKSIHNGNIVVDGAELVIYKHPKTHSMSEITDTELYVRMTVNEREKLAGIDEKANYYEHPKTHSIDMITETDEKVIMTADERKKIVELTETVEELADEAFTKEEREKLAGIDEKANYYEHPETHSAEIIEETDDRLWYTPSERTLLQNIEDISDECKYQDTIEYRGFNEDGKLIERAWVFFVPRRNILPPVQSLPTDTIGYTEGDSFLVMDELEVYFFNGVEFEKDDLVYEVQYTYNDKGLVATKLVIDHAQFEEQQQATPVSSPTPIGGVSPLSIFYEYFYDEHGNRVGVKKTAF